MTQLHTTFALARKAEACPEGYKAVAKALGSVRAYGRNTPIPLIRILDIRGLDDALWCLRCVLPEEEAARDRLAWLLACDYEAHEEEDVDRQTIQEGQKKQGESWEILVEAARVAARVSVEAAEAEQNWQAQRLREVLA